MQIIPVIDLKGGIVVHAVGGDRQHYQAVHRHSILTSGSDIDAVLRGFLAMHAFGTFYIADIDAITGIGNHKTLIDKMVEQWPEIEFWIDSGSSLTDLTPGNDKRKIVIGTESQSGQPTLSEHDFILSLDFKQQLPAGDPAWFSDYRYWPEQVIVMTLNRVGSNLGPDFDKLAALRASNPDTRLIAAGGVRDARDLDRLQAIGIDAVLVATSLHTGAINARDLSNR